MTDSVIQIESLTKRYRLGATTGIRRWIGNNEWLDALRDVNFEVMPGEAIGIIGHNGAGKSTLLKILAQITPPSAGRIALRGRVASLLEVGTGFHPELTGRENIYLNGAILGMHRREVKAKFDEIVAFSGVESFLDTPVKRYSSGMRVRLAFAVAAHLEPEILIVDEVLAVGDAAFQAKCLGKMRDVTGHGRTVLFVSHNMAAVQHLCARAVWLHQGCVRMIGDSASTIAHYLADHGSTNEHGGLDRFRDGGMKPILRDIRLLNASDEAVDRVPAGHSLTVEITYEAEGPLRDPSFGIGIDTADGKRLIFAQTKLQHGLIERIPARGTLRCHIPRIPLTSGEYTMSFGVSADGRKIDGLWHALRFHIDPWDVYGSGQLPSVAHGPVLMEARWTLPAEDKLAQMNRKEAA